MESGSQSSTASTSTCTSTSSSREMELLNLQHQVQFLELSDHIDPLFPWELVDLLDAHQQHSDSRALPFASSDGSSLSCSTLPPINNAPLRHHPHSPHAHDHDDASPHRPFGGDYDDDETHGLQFDQDNEDDEAYDLNDELVPWEVSNKLGRQRTRKRVKMALSKMNNSKRSSTLFLRPGCIRGKKGFGLKHSC